MSDPVMERVGIATQCAVTVGATGQGYLDALERLGGAKDAEDFDWAVSHYGVVLQCQNAIALDLATLAAGMLAAGAAMEGSQSDVQLKPGARGLGAWIRTVGVQDEITEHLKSSGLRPGEVSKIIELWKTDPAYTGEMSKLSAGLTAAAPTLHALAMRLLSASGGTGS